MRQQFQGGTSEEFLKWEFNQILKSARSYVKWFLDNEMGNLESAISYAKDKSCAGTKVWEAIRKEFN